MLRLFAAFVVIVAVLIPGFYQPLDADVLPLPKSRFNEKRASDGKAFKSKKWKTSGQVTWSRREGSPVKNDHALQLAPQATVSRAVEISKKDTARSESYDPSQWTFIVNAGAALSPGQSGTTEVIIRLEVPGTSTAFSRRMKVTKEDFLQRIFLPIAAGRLKPGEWRLTLKCVGKSPVLIDDIFFLRVPHDPKVMKFAKPNGKNGPDRLDSGTLGFVAHTAHEHSPLPVVSVREDSPAGRAGMLPGDIILEIGGKSLPVNSCKPGFDWFDNGHEQALGRASEEALAGRRVVEILILRGGQTKRLALRLAKRAPLPQGFPFDDTVTPQFYDELLDFVRRTRRKKGHWANGGTDWIQTSFAGLALLGRRDPRDAQAVHEVADWFLKKFAAPEEFGNLGYWTASYAGIFLAEYYLATGDDRVRPWIERSLRWVEAGFHTSKWGMPALGHGPSGLPYGQKALMAPASHVIVFEALARKAGIQSKIWETLLPYMKHSWSDPEKKGHGAMGYNGSYRDQAEFWSRSGLFALAAQLRDEQRYMRRMLVKVMLKRHSFMRNSHAYGNPGDVWGLVGLHAADASAFSQVMRAWRWSFGGAWDAGYGLRHTTAHMGSPYMGGEGLLNPAMAMLLSVRHKGLFITGAPDSDRGWLARRGPALADGRIRFGRNETGQVVLTAHPEGASLRYTTDGSEPRHGSAIYTEPLDLPLGGLVRARFDLGGKSLGRVHEYAAGLPKSGWTVRQANGALDPKAAVQRAGALFDGDPLTPWQPDRGEGTHDFPFQLIIDLGESVKISGLVFSGPGLPGEIRMSLGESPDELEKAAQNCTTVVEKGQARAMLETDQRGRYLFVSILKPAKGKKARFGEMDLIWPVIKSERTKKDLAISFDQSGYTLRYERGKGDPSTESPALKGRLVVEKGKAVRVRRFDESGRGVGPIEVFRR